MDEKRNTDIGSALRGLDQVEAAGKKSGEKGLPPVHLWNPEFCGDLDIRIARDGTWYYLGTPFKRERLVHEPPLHLRRAGDKPDIVVTEHDARDVGNNLFPVGYWFTIQLYAFFPANLFDDNAMRFTFSLESCFYGEIRFAVSDEGLISSCPKGGTVAGEINSLEKVCLPLSVLADEKQISRVRRNSGVIKITKVIETNVRESHAQSSCIGITIWK